MCDMIHSGYEQSLQEEVALMDVLGEKTLSGRDHHKPVRSAHHSHTHTHMGGGEKRHSFPKMGNNNNNKKTTQFCLPVLFSLQHASAGPAPSSPRRWHLATSPAHITHTFLSLLSVSFLLLLPPTPPFTPPHLHLSSLNSQFSILNSPLSPLRVGDDSVHCRIITHVIR